MLYAATTGPTGIAEVFQESRVIDRAGNDPALVSFEVARDLLLLDLTSSWPTRAGASMAINTGQRCRAQRWARAIYSAFPALDGIYYASSMYRNAPAVALFERAESAIPTRPTFHHPLSDLELDTALRNVAADIGHLLD